MMHFINQQLIDTQPLATIPNSPQPYQRVASKEPSLPKLRCVTCVRSPLASLSE
jgi:hypothetical protein